MKTDSEPRLLRLKPSAQRLSISVAKLRREIQAGRIPYISLGDHAPWLVEIRDLDAWTEKNKSRF